MLKSDPGQVMTRLDMTWWLATVLSLLSSCDRPVFAEQSDFACTSSIPRYCLFYRPIRRIGELSCFTAASGEMGIGWDGVWWWGSTHARPYLATIGIASS